MPETTFSVVLESHPVAVVWAPAMPVLVLVLVLVPCAGWCDFPGAGIDAQGCLLASQQEGWAPSTLGPAKPQSQLPP